MPGEAQPVPTWAGALGPQRDTSHGSACSCERPQNKRTTLTLCVVPQQKCEKGQRAPTRPSAGRARDER